MKKSIVLLLVLFAIVVLLLINEFVNYSNITEKNNLNSKTQNILYQAFSDKDIEAIDKILLETKFYFNGKILTYNESVRTNIKEFLKDDSKYIDFKKIGFSATNMNNEYPLYFLIWNNNKIDGISGELYWEVEYRDGKLYSIKSDNNDLLFEYLFINNNIKNDFKLINKE